MRKWIRQFSILISKVTYSKENTNKRLCHCNNSALQGSLTMLCCCIYVTISKQPDNQRIAGAQFSVPSAKAQVMLLHCYPHASIHKWSHKQQPAASPWWYALCSASARSAVAFCTIAKYTLPKHRLCGMSGCQSDDMNATSLSSWQYILQAAPPSHHFSGFAWKRRIELCAEWAWSRRPCREWNAWRRISRRQRAPCWRSRYNSQMALSDRRNPLLDSRWSKPLQVEWWIRCFARSSKYYGANLKLSPASLAIIWPLLIEGKVDSLVVCVSIPSKLHPDKLLKSSEIVCPGKFCLTVYACH